MSKLIVYILDGILFAALMLYCCSKILNKKIDWKDKKFWIIFFIEAIYTCFSYQLTDNFIRVIINYLLISLITLLYFKANVMQSMLTGFVTMFLLFLAEIVYMLIISIGFTNSIETLKSNYGGTLITNVSIATLALIFINTKCIYSPIQKIIRNIKFNGNKTMLIYAVLSLSAVSILLYYIYFEINLIYASILCLILIVTFTLLTLYLFKEKSENQKLQVEYDILLDNLIEYEQMYQMQKMINHENKNELSTIRGLASKSNKKLLDYIDELIDIKVTQKEKWMDILKRIPDPALRGLLYYKMANMEHKKINIDFDISRQVTIKKFKSISSELNKKACKILGIYLDNAIQAVENLKDKNIKVSIYLDVFEEDILVISVMNNYKGFIEMDRLYEKGYSTKGKGRGLGLPMVKDILDNEPGLSNQTQIIRNNFVQELKIRLKQK